MNAMTPVLADTRRVLAIHPVSSITKGTDPHGRPRFQMATVWVLEGGAEAGYLLRCKRRKDMPHDLDMLQRFAAAGRLQAGVTDGQVTKTVTSIG